MFGPEQQKKLEERIGALKDYLRNRDWDSFARQSAALGRFFGEMGQRALADQALQLEKAGRAASGKEEGGLARMHRARAQKFCAEKTGDAVAAFLGFLARQRKGAPRQAAPAGAPRAAPTGAPRAAPKKSLGSIAEIPGLNIAKGLEFTGGSLDFYKLTLQQFCDDFPGLRDAVFDDVRKKDWKDYGIKLHGFKGMLAMIGAEELSEWAKKLEFAGKAADAKGSAEDARVCASEARPIMQAIAALRDRILAALDSGGDGEKAP